MPLHLLSKKSWNIYNPAAQERIAKDEADAAAREAENDRRMQEYDSERRLALLRGEDIPAPPPLPLEDSGSKRRRDDGDRSAKVELRKRRRLHGEDDTDRDLRLAREDIEGASEARRNLSTTDDKRSQYKSTRSDAPIVDAKGHISLFPIDPRTNKPNHGQKNPEVEAEKNRKKQDLEDQYTIRFANAAGKDGLKTESWYARPHTSKINSSTINRSLTLTSKNPTLEQEQTQKQEEDLYALGKDAWGRPDPKRQSRDQNRISSSDPLAFMKKAQTQFSRARDDKQAWEGERAREVVRLRGEEEERDVERRRRRREREERRRKEEEMESSGQRRDYVRRRRGSSENSLEGFELDAVELKSGDGRSESQSRSKSRSDRHSKHRPSRDRDRERATDKEDRHKRRNADPY